LLEIFHNDILSLSSNREIEFSIDLMSKYKPISMAPYTMPPFQLEDPNK